MNQFVIAALSVVLVVVLLVFLWAMVRKESFATLSDYQSVLLIKYSVNPACDVARRDVEQLLRILPYYLYGSGIDIKVVPVRFYGPICYPEIIYYPYGMYNDNGALPDGKDLSGTYEQVIGFPYRPMNFARQIFNAISMWH